jgi:hypothetical protein
VPLSVYHRKESKVKAFVIVAGIVLALVGWGVGGEKFSVSQHGYAADCGTARNPEWGNAEQTDSLNSLVGKPTGFEAICRDKAETRSWISKGLMLVGGFIAIGGIVYGTTKRRTAM